MLVSADFKDAAFSCAMDARVRAPQGPAIGKQLEVVSVSARSDMHGGNQRTSKPMLNCSVSTNAYIDRQ